MQKQAEKFCEELDRYLVASHTQLHQIPLEDNPDLKLSLKLLQLDFSQDSRNRASVRHNVLLERGERYNTASDKLIQSAHDRQKKNKYQGRKHLSVFLAIAVILGVWSWTYLSTPQTINSLPQPSPIIAITRVTVSSEQSSNITPKPLPTPLAYLSSQGNYASSITPTIQDTPLDLAITR